MGQFTTAARAIMRESAARIQQEAAGRSAAIADLAQARRQERAETIAEIGRLYEFSRDEDLTFLNAGGQAVQAAMRLTRKERPLEGVTVVCRADAADLDAGPDGLLWFVTDMAGAEYEAGDYIAAVQAYIKTRRTHR